MGKTRRYKKKLARAVAAGTNDGGGTDEQQPRQTNYMELADELLSLKGDDGTTSVRSVMKSVKSGGGGESLKLKKEAKLFLKHALLLKKLEKTSKRINKTKKKKSNKNHDGDDDDDSDDEAVDTSKQKVLDWPVGNTTNGNATQVMVAPKKYRKGYQKKQNAQLAKDLVLFSKKIKTQLKNPAQSINKM